jgi:hypothetical protein
MRRLWNLPARWLNERFNLDRESKEASSCGISPERLFQDRSNDSILSTFLKAHGIIPLNELFDKFNAFNADRAPIISGILPLKLFSDKSISTIREAKCNFSIICIPLLMIDIP